MIVYEESLNSRLERTTRTIASAGLAVGLAAGLWACNPQNALTRKAAKAVATGLRRVAFLKGLRPERLSLAERMAFYKIPGVSVVLLDRNKVVWSGAFGEKDRQTHQSLTPETMFQAGAFSQMVASAAALQLSEEGKIDVMLEANRQLRSWEIPPEARRSLVTPRELMAHASGMSDQIFSGYAHDEPRPTLLQILDGEKPANNGPVWAPPRPIATHVQYSESGYVVLQQLLEDAAGMPFSALARSTIFGPLVMVHSSFDLPLADDLRSTAASGHGREGQAVAGLWRDYPEAAAKGLWTTPSDFGAFLADLLRSATDGSGKLLRLDTARFMLSPKVENAGFGFLFDGDGDNVNFHLRGKTQGYACAMSLYPAKGQGAVIMTNSDNGDLLIQEILCGLSDAYGWPHYKPEEKPVLRLAPETYRQYAGTYEVNPDYRLDVTVEDYYLVIHPTGQAPTKFYAEGQTLFYSVDPYIRIQFFSDKTGRFDSLVLWQQDFELQAKKVR